MFREDKIWSVCFLSWSRQPGDAQGHNSITASELSQKPQVSQLPGQLPQLLGGPCAPQHSRGL